MGRAEGGAGEFLLHTRAFVWLALSGGSKVYLEVVIPGIQQRAGPRAVRYSLPVISSSRFVCVGLSVLCFCRRAQDLVVGGFCDASSTGDTWEQWLILTWVITLVGYCRAIIRFLRLCYCSSCMGIIIQSKSSLRRCPLGLWLGPWLSLPAHAGPGRQGEAWTFIRARPFP